MNLDNYAQNLHKKQEAKTATTAHLRGGGGQGGGGGAGRIFDAI